MSRFDERVQEVRDAVEGGCAAVAEPVARLVADLDEPLPEKEARSLLGALRRERCFDAMCDLADALLEVGAEDPQVVRQYAQALIDTGRLGLARRTLEGLADELPEGDGERSEVLGLLGRVHKQGFVRRAERGDPGAGELDRALGYYRRAYDQDPAWHGANLVALTHRAEQDGIAVDMPSREIADRLIDDLHRRKPRREWGPWDHAAAGEAALGLGEWAVAAGHYGQFARHPEVSGFAIAGAVRQLREIWRLGEEGGDGQADRGGGGPADVLTALEASVHATAQGGALTSSSGQLGRMSRRLEQAQEGAADCFEAILGDNPQVPIRVLVRLLAAASSVCQIVDRHRHEERRPSGGTGFLVRADALNPKWDGVVVVTNNHVLSDDGLRPSVRHVHADAIFHFWDGEARPRTFRIDRLLGVSNRHDVDFAIATLVDPPPVEHALSTLCFDPDVLGPRGNDPPERVYVVGHPKGRGLEFSLSDNVVLDHDLLDEQPGHPACRRIHYKAPTEKGMSGSPVFEPQQFEVIGLHRQGGAVHPIREVADRDAYEANEAAWLGSIRDRLARPPP